MTALIVTYGGIKLTDYFEVKPPQRSILPPRDIGLLTVPTKHGAYFTGANYGVREITMEVKVKANTPELYMNTIRFLARCFDIEEPTDLEISDEPNKVQYALLVGSSEMTNQILEIGKGTLTFLCPDPFAYSNIVKTITPVSKKFTFTNLGTTTTFPIFTTTFSTNATFLSITSPDGIILIGNPSDPEQIVLPKTQYSINDGMTSMTGWATAGNILDSGRLVSGTAGVIGEGIGSLNYGTGTAGSKIWHGPAIRKDLSVQVKDFTVKARIDFYSQDGTSSLDGAQSGRLEIYLFDQNGGKIGKLVMRDSYKEFEYNVPEIFIGNSTFLEQESSIPKGKKVKQKLYTTDTVKKGETWASIAKDHKMTASDLATLNGKTTSDPLTIGMKLKVYDKTITKTVYPEHVGNWNDFYGEFTLQRVGNVWYAEVSRMNPANLKKTKTIKRIYTDSGGLYTTADLSYVVIHFAQWEVDQTVQKMKVTDLKVIKHNTDTIIDVPAIFSAGDELEVNLENSSVWLNGDLFMDELDIGSEFFPIYEGTTEVKVNTDDPGATFSADFTERFL